MELYKIKEELLNGKRLLDLKLKVTFYARVSTDKDEQLNSLDNQIDHFKNYIKDNSNWTYIEGYIDEGISGSSVKGRINFLKMIEDGKNGVFDLIITKEVSRFSRNLSDSIKYTQELLKYNVGVYFQSNGINTFDSNSEFILNMMGSVAQEEVKRLSERVRWGLNKSIKRGRVLGNDRIIGYKKNKAKLVIEEGEAKFVKKVFELYSTGKYGFYSLAIALYEKGYRNSKNKIYEYCTLKRMIENPKYKGYYRTNTVQTIDYKEKKQKRIKKEDWIVYKDDSIPAIVSEELWNKCNDILNKRSRNYGKKIGEKRPYKNRYTYSGILWCSDHNVTFQRDGKLTKSTWACGCYRKYHLKGCLSPILTEEYLDNIFKVIMKLIFNNQDEIIDEMLHIYSSISLDINYDKDIKVLEDSILNIEKKKDKLLELSTYNSLSNDDFILRNDKLNSEIFVIKENIEKLRNEQILFQKSESRLKEIEVKIKDQFSFKNNMYDFVQKFVDKVIVTKIDGNRKKVKLDIYLNTGNHLVYKDGIVSIYIGNTKKLELCVND